MDLEKERDQQFEHALEAGNFDLLKKLLEEGASVNTWSVKHWTPLFSAVEKENSELISLFLEKGAEVNLSNRHDLGTPLHCASDLGRCDYVKLLLEKGAEVNKSSVHLSTNFPSSKCTALFVASARGHCEIIELLLANKADVNLSNDKNEIPLDIACQNGHIDVVKVLLDSGADCNWSGRWEGTPLLYACERNYFDIAKMLLDKGANIDPVGRSRPLHSPLYHAALFGYTNLFKLLLQRGAEIDVKNGNGDGPLHGVCFKGHHVVAELLLGMGVDLNRISLDGRSPLFIACAAGHSLIVESLLEKGADVDEDIDSAWGVSWQTPLYLALREGHREMISSLWDMNVELSYPYDKDHPMGKTLTEVRTMIYYSKIMNSNSTPVNVIGKFHSNLLVKAYLTKMKVAGLADTPNVAEEILDKCIAELERINCFKIHENVTLGIVFQRAKDPLYQRNQKLLKKVEDYLRSPLPQSEFPLYTKLLRSTLKKSKKKLSLLTSASLVMEKLVRQPKLPLHVLENILKHLDEADLENIFSLE